MFAPRTAVALPPHGSGSGANAPDPRPGRGAICRPGQPLPGPVADGTRARSVFGGEVPAQRRERGGEQPGDVHLGDPDALSDLVLGHALTLPAATEHAAEVPRGSLCANDESPG